MGKAFYTIPKTHIKSTLYKGVASNEMRDGLMRRLGRQYIARLTYKGQPWASARFDTEREAALTYDKKLIELGEQPVNILKPKQ